MDVNKQFIRIGQSNTLFLRAVLLLPICENTVLFVLLASALFRRKTRSTTLLIALKTPLRMPHCTFSKHHYHDYIAITGIGVAQHPPCVHAKHVYKVLSIPFQHSSGVRLSVLSGSGFLGSGRGTDMVARYGHEFLAFRPP